MSPADQVACLSTLASLESRPVPIHVMNYKKLKCPGLDMCFLQSLQHVMQFAAHVQM